MSDLDLKVKLDVSDIFNQTSAIKQAIQTSVQQGFSSAAGGASLYQAGFSPIQYAQPNFARMLDPSLYQRDMIVQGALSKLPPPFYTPPGIDPTVYNQEYWSQWGERNLTPVVTGSAAFFGGIGAWLGLPKLLSQIGPKTEVAPIWAGLRGAIGMSTAPVQKKLGAQLFGGWLGEGGAAAGWRAAEKRGFGLLGKAVGLTGGFAFGIGPQLIASEIVGYGVEKMIEDVQTRSEMRNVGFAVMGPSFSQAFGGRGFTRDQIEDMADWMKQRARESGIKVPTLLGMTEFGAEVGAIGRTGDVGQIKKQIITMMDTLGRIAKETRTSLEEVMGYARDLKNMGYDFGTTQMNSIIGRIPSVIRWTGMPGSQVMGMMQMGAEQNRGTGISMRAGAEAMAMNAVSATQMRDLGILEPELFRQLGGDIPSVANSMQQMQGRFLMSRPFVNMLAGMTSMGPVSQVANRYISGGVGIDQIISGIGQIGVSPQATAAFMMNKEKLASQLSPLQITQMQGKFIEDKMRMAGWNNTPETWQRAAVLSGIATGPIEAQLLFRQYTWGPALERNAVISDARVQSQKDIADISGLRGVVGAVRESLAFPWTLGPVVGPPAHATAFLFTEIARAPGRVWFDYVTGSEIAFSGSLGERLYKDFSDNDRLSLGQKSNVRYQSNKMLFSSPGQRFEMAKGLNKENIKSRMLSRNLLFKMDTNLRNATFAGAKRADEPWYDLSQLGRWFETVPDAFFLNREGTPTNILFNTLADITMAQSSGDPTAVLQAQEPLSKLDPNLLAKHKVTINAILSGNAPKGVLTEGMGTIQRGQILQSFNVAGNIEHSVFNKQFETLLGTTMTPEGYKKLKKEIKDTDVYSQGDLYLQKELNKLPDIYPKTKEGIEKLERRTLDLAGSINVDTGVAKGAVSSYYSLGSMKGEMRMFGEAMKSALSEWGDNVILKTRDTKIDPSKPDVKPKILTMENGGRTSSIKGGYD